MPESVYGETPETQAPPPQLQPQPAWSQKLRQPASLAAILLVLAFIALVVYWNRPQPPPPVLGASERSIAISPDGKLLLVGTLNGALRLVSTESSHALARATLPGRIQSVSFGPDGTAL